MKLLDMRNSITVLLLLSLVSLNVTSCSNSAGNEEEHELTPQGAILKMNGQEIVRYDEEGLSGAIEVAEGEETALITAFFIAEDGDEFQPEESEYELRLDGIDESIAEIEQHSEDGAWSFHIHGVSQGETGVILLLWHTDENHKDFETPSIPVTVN